MIVLIDVCSCCEPNTDYYGNDIKAKTNGLDNGAHVDSAVSCQLLCQAQPACRFFTYIPDIGECWLKGTDAGRWHSDNRVSGKKYCGNRSICRYLNICCIYISCIQLMYLSMLE